MDDAFDRLEHRVRKAAETVARLRADKQAAEEQAQDARARLAEAEKRLSGLEQERGSAAESAQKVEGLQREVATLRHEREEVRARVARLVDLLDALD